MKRTKERGGREVRKRDKIRTEELEERGTERERSKIES
jgi:hypothetical protein